MTVRVRQAAIVTFLLLLFVPPFARTRVADAVEPHPQAPLKSGPVEKCVLPKLPRREPADVGMDGEKLANIDELVATGIAQRKMPGCVVCVGRRGAVVWLKAYGRRQVQPDDQPMTVDTVFDCASLTKPIATATSIMLLVERGRLQLDDPVAKHLPDFAANDKQRISIQDLLIHQSGLIADNALADYDQGLDEAYRRIDALPLFVPTGSKFIYSDVNYIVLGRLVRQAGGEDLHAFTQRELFGPLGLNETSYLPAAPLRERAVPTQQQGDRWLRGEVHDPRAARLGGIAGHAGLFSTATDLAVYAQMMLQHGEYAGVRILAADTVAKMTAAYKVSSGIRGLGWDKRTGYSSNRGEGMSDSAYGHGGFTGTAIWIDPKLELFVIFLSNRVHPDGKGNVNPLAGRIGGAAVIACEEQSGGRARRGGE